MTVTFEVTVILQGTRPGDAIDASTVDELGAFSYNVDKRRVQQAVA